MSLRVLRHAIARGALWLTAAIGSGMGAGVVATSAADSSATAAARWSDGYTLVVLQPGADLRRATRLVQARGGSVAVELPPRCLAGWIPPQLDRELVGHAGIHSIHRTTATLPAALTDGRETRRAARFFTRAARGELEFASAGAEVQAHPQASRPDLVPGPDFVAGPGVLLPDAWPAPAISEVDIAANLAAQGIGAHRKSGASIAANSETMTGTIAVALVFVESDGSGNDPDTYDWTADSEDDVYDSAAAALSWWSHRADDHGDCWAVFRLEAYFATEDDRSRQWREPVLRPSTDFANAIASVLGNHGYTTGNHLARAAAFDAALRLRLDTDWAYSAFVAANPSGDTQFTDGYAAWAYLGGPYTALLQRSFGWSFKQVFAHESAHAFNACDEYSVEGYGGCSSCAGCGDNGIANGNCEACNPDPDSCMMRSNAFALCDYTAAQLGWGQRPCVPMALPAPQLTSITPATAAPGEEIEIVLHGDGFTAGGGLDCGTGVVALSLEFVSPTEQRARFRVDLEAAPGPRDVAVVGSDGQVAVLTAGFAVRPTPRHYVGAGGGNRFPYDRPEHAALDLATVLTACSRGDTVLVRGGNYAPFALQKTLVMLGNWTAAFGSRSPATPTVVHGTVGAPAVVIDGGDNHSILDGFVLRGGSGTWVSPPTLGPVVAGGGILSLQASPTLRGCTLEDNTAGSVAAPGAGAGGLFWGGAPVLQQCIVRRNVAERGAGLAFIDCDVHLLDAVIEDNAASGDGGGVFAVTSVVDCRGVRFAGNSAGSAGGGLYASDGIVRLDATLLAANRAVDGGAGAHIQGAEGVALNVTATDNEGGSGIAWLAAPAAITVRSCIFAHNDLAGLLVGGGMPPETDWNLFWQNQPSDRIGFDAGAHDIVAEPLFAQAAARDYRLGLSSPALDSGDAGPARADVDGSINDRGAYGGPHARPPAPARVASVHARILPGRTHVQWTPSPAAGITAYAIYRHAAFVTGVAGATPLVTVPGAQFEHFDVGAPDGVAYTVVAIDGDGHASGATSAAAILQPTDAIAPVATLALHPVAPNPVNPGTWVAFELPDARRVSLGVYTVNGRRIRTLGSAAFAAGPHRLYWDGRDDAGSACASGVYWVQLEAGGERRSRRIIVVR